MQTENETVLLISCDNITYFLKLFGDEQFINLHPVVVSIWQQFQTFPINFNCIFFLFLSKKKDFNRSLKKSIICPFTAFYIYCVNFESKGLKFALNTCIGTVADNFIAKYQPICLWYINNTYVESV